MKRGAVLGSDDAALLRDSPLMPSPRAGEGERVKGTVGPEGQKGNDWSVNQWRRVVA